MLDPIPAQHGNSLRLGQLTGYRGYSGQPPNRDPHLGLSPHVAQPLRPLTQTSRDYVSVGRRPADHLQHGVAGQAGMPTDMLQQQYPVTEQATQPSPVKLDRRARHRPYAREYTASARSCLGSRFGSVATRSWLRLQPR